MSGRSVSLGAAELIVELVRPGDDDDTLEAILDEVAELDEIGDDDGR